MVGLGDSWDFLPTREGLIQPLRSAWEDDTCLGLQSEGTRSKK